MEKAMLKLVNERKIFIEGSDTEVRAIDNADFSILEGEMVALMGSSGFGKSTLLNIIGGLTPITKGEVFVEFISVFNR